MREREVVMVCIWCQICTSNMEVSVADMHLVSDMHLHPYISDMHLHTFPPALDACT